MRDLECQSGEAVQMIVRIGGDKYIVGDLTKREGIYQLLMDDFFNYSSVKMVPNKFKFLEGNYSSFKTLEKRVKSLRSEGLYFIGSNEYSFYPAVRNLHVDRSLGQSYQKVGKIVYPRLVENEIISIEKISTSVL